MKITVFWGRQMFYAPPLPPVLIIRPCDYTITPPYLISRENMTYFYPRLICSGELHEVQQFSLLSTMFVNKSKAGRNILNFSV